MRCYCCNTHKNLHLDPMSNRFYCEECFSVSMVALRELQEFEDLEEMEDDSEREES